MVERDLWVYRQKYQEKRDLEAVQLRLQTSRSYQRFEAIKTMAVTGGIVTALLGLGILGFSAYQWNANVARERQVRIEERLDAALARLGLERTARSHSCKNPISISNLSNLQIDPNRKKSSKIFAAEIEFPVSTFKLLP